MKRFLGLFCIVACLTSSCAPQSPNGITGFSDKTLLPSPNPSPSSLPTPPNWLTHYDWQKIANWCADGSLFASDKPVNFTADQNTQTVVLASRNASLLFNKKGKLLRTKDGRFLTKTPLPTPLSNALKTALAEYIRTIDHDRKRVEFEIVCSRKGDGYSITLMDRAEQRVGRGYLNVVFDKTGRILSAFGGY